MSMATQTRTAKAMYNNFYQMRGGDPRRRQTPDYRYHLTHDLLVNLHRGECCAVVGVGSCGKSRLLRHLSRPETLEYHLAEGAYEHLIVLVECNAWTGDSIWAAYEGIARSLDDFMQNSGHPAVQSMRRELEGLYKAVVDERDLAPKHLMTALGIILKGTRLKLTLCFDEFDFVFERFETQLFRNLRAMRNAHKYQLTYLVAVRKQLPYGRPEEDWPDVEEFYELFSDNTFAIGPYDEKDATEMIIDLESRYEFPLRSRSREWLIAVTGGHPGLIGASFRHLEQGRLQPATLKEMTQVLVNEATTWKECRKIWDPMRSQERAVLKRVATNSRLSRDDQAALQEIKAKGLVREVNDRGQVAIFSPIFQEFLRHVEE
jgi:hypothetical protein